MAYYKLRMIPRNGECKPYHAYTTGYDKSEASINVRDELLSGETFDVIDAITEISEEEYNKGYAEFGNGVRA